MKSNYVILTLAFTTILATTAAIFYYNKSNNCNAVSGQINQMDALTIKEITDQYRDNQLLHINNGMRITDRFGNSGDAYAISFQIPVIKNFIDYTISEALKNDPNVNIEDLGLHIYYAAYPSEKMMSKLNNLDKLDTAYQFRHTLVMLPSIKVGSESIDFNPLDPDTYPDMVKENEANSLRNKVNDPDYILMALTTDISAQNHGGLFPPKDGGGLAFPYP